MLRPWRTQGFRCHPQFLFRFPFPQFRSLARKHWRRLNHGMGNVRISRGRVLLASCGLAPSPGRWHSGRVPPRSTSSSFAALTSRVPAQLLIVCSALIQYSGAALAVFAFSAVKPASVAWWRGFVGGVVLCLWWRPWRGGLTRADLQHAAFFGVALVCMNASFYESISRLPLGAAVSLEFLGPVSVAVIRGTGWAPRIAALLALAGVVSIGGVGLNLADPNVQVGIPWILGAAAAWAAYIVLGQKAASAQSGMNNLALGCAFSALLSAPILAPGAMAAFADTKVLLAVVSLAFLSTVFPYSLEAVAMKRVSAATFALFTALLPATSALIGLVFLRQVPTVGTLVGLVLISCAVWITSWAASRQASADIPGEILE